MTYMGREGIFLMQAPVVVIEFQYIVNNFLRNAVGMITKLDLEVNSAIYVICLICFKFIYKKGARYATCKVPCFVYAIMRAFIVRKSRHLIKCSSYCIASLTLWQYVKQLSVNDEACNPIYLHSYCIMAILMGSIWFCQILETLFKTLLTFWKKRFSAELRRIVRH